MSRSVPLCLLALTALATPRPAQDRARWIDPPELRGGRASPLAHPSRPVLHVTWDAHEQRVTSRRWAAAGELGLGGPCFDNSDIPVPVDPGYSVTNSGEELVDWGRKNCPGASRLRSFTVAYRSEAIDVSVGGPGAAFSLALFSGTTGFGNLGTQVFRRTFTGMPADGAPAGPDVVYEHNGQPFVHTEPLVFLTIDFGFNPLPLPDGPIGWSFLQLDGDTGPAVVSAPHSQLGTDDALDLYRPGPATPATYAGTFNFGTGGYASLYLQLDEIANNETAAATVLNGSGVNPLLLSQIFPAVPGEVWALRVDATVPGIYVPPYTLLMLSAASLSPLTTPYGELLVDPSQRLFPTQAGEAGYAFAIPPNASLLGLAFFAQAAVLPPALPSVTLTNSLRIRIGY